MSFATYSDLQTSIASWLGRSDLTTSIPDFITMFEAYANRKLRTREMMTTTNLTPNATTGVDSLPTDYLTWRRATWLGSKRVELVYAAPDYIQGAYNTLDAGTPVLFTIEGSSFYVRPVDSTDIEFLYFQKIPALSASNTSNWLLAAHPEAYLFGSLCEASGFNVDANNLGIWKARRDEVIDEIQTLANLSYGGGGMKAYGPVV